MKPHPVRWGFFTNDIYICMFKSIPKSNVVLRRFSTFKSWSLDSTSVGYNVIRNLSGSFDNYENTFVNNNLNQSFNEFSFNKSLRALYYNNVPQKIGFVVNWDANRYQNLLPTIYQVSQSNGVTEYNEYYDSATKKYVYSFRDWLYKENIIVTNNGDLIKGSWPDPTKIHGKMKNFGSSTERLIGDRYFVLQIPQKYIGEEIQPGSVSLQDIGTNKFIIDDSFGNMVYSDNQSVIVGNIFYNSGIITITYKTENVSDELYNFGGSNFILNFKSTKTIYENEIFIEVLPNEFTVSTNPTAVKVYNGFPYIRSRFTINNQDYDFRISSSLDISKKIGFGDYEFSSSIDPTGSYLAPYITTIGLYDDFYNLVAVAKVPSKPKSAPDYPINFVVRFDT